MSEEEKSVNMEAIEEYEPPAISELPSFPKQDEKLQKLEAMRRERQAKAAAAEAEAKAREGDVAADAEDDEAFIDDELDDPEEELRKRKQKRAPKAKRRRAREEQLETDPGADPEKKSKVDQLFEEALKSSKTGSRRKRTEIDTDVAVEQSHQIIHAMRVAADEDRIAVEEGRPALSKLGMLPRVKVMLQRSSLWDVLLDEGVLNGIADWLRPFDDGTMPALEIRRTMLEILEQLPIDTDVLRESDIGRVLYFYCRCKVELNSVQRRFQALMNRLVARVLNKSSRQQYSYKSASSAAIDGNSKFVNPSPAAQATLANSSASAPSEEQELSRFVRMPREIPTAFEYVPQSTVFADREERKKPDSGRHKRLKQIIQTSAQKTRK